MSATRTVEDPTVGQHHLEEGKEGEPRTEAERRRCPASPAHSVLMGTSCSGQAQAGCPYKAEIGHGREVGNTMKPLKHEEVAGRILDQTLACRPSPICRH